MSTANSQGQQEISTGNSDFNAYQFIAKQVMSQAATSMPVQVVAVNPATGSDAIGTVDVMIMVNQLAGDGTPTPHGTVHSLPYMRLQGGLNAIIVDPVVGDRGIGLFCSHDISAVKSTKAVSNPGSRRRFDFADGIYLGGILNGAPTQFLSFSGSTANLTARGTIILTAPEVQTTGNLTVGSGATGSFGTIDGKSVTVTAGIITTITP